MRCFSCGSLNASQALECTRCRKLLDPIAAAATVAIYPDPIEMAAPAFEGTKMPSSSSLPALSMKLASPLPPPPTAYRFEPSRRSLTSADLDFLTDSIGSTRLKELQAIAPPPTTTGLTQCASCRRMLGSDRILQAQAKRGKPICVDCQARQANREEGSVRRKDQLRIVGGFLLGAVAGVGCALLTPQFGLDPAHHTFNWPLAAAVGAIIGLAVRLGGLNKPGAALQIVSLVVSAGGLLGCLYLGLNNLYGRTLNFDQALDAFKVANPSLLDYFLIGLGLLLAFVIPSGVFGGHDDSLSASQ